jgi:uncharacterized RDD family membrane protein YckC
VSADEETLRFDLETPEHVPLPFQVASAASRFLALFIDIVVIGLAILMILLVAVMAAFAFDLAGGNYVLAMVLVSMFVIRNFYFTFFELYWHGQTFGKRKVGIRVIARDGGSLSAEMIFARNLTRDLEIFLPAMVLFLPDLLFGEAPGWARVIAAAWMLALAILPLLNRHRARIGDLIGGTVVVVAPKASLLPDLVTAERRPIEAQYTFSREQLDIYGIQELQVLEDVLRGDVLGREDLLLQICDKVKRKIRWDPSRWQVHPEAFLRSFYAAQRTRLEHKMLLGSRQERKVR